MAQPIDFSGMERGIGKALQSLPGVQPPLPSQQEVWTSIRDNPDLVLSYVKERTGTSGSTLLAEIDHYSQAMKERYG